MTKFLLRHWSLLPSSALVFVVLRILCTMIDIFVPLATGWLLDAVVDTDSGQRMDQIWRELAVFLLLVVLFICCRNSLTLITNRISAKAMMELAKQSFAKIQRLSSDWHANTFSGSTVRKLTRGMWAFNAATETLAFGIFPAVLVSVGIVAVFAYNWLILGVLVFVGIALFTACSILLAVKWVAPANAAAQEVDSQVSGLISDAISASSIVKSFAAEEREDRHLADLVERWRAGAMKAWDRNAYTSLIQAAILIILQAGLLAGGIWLWSRGMASAGDIVMIVATQALFNGYLRDIGLHVRNLQRALSEMQDLVDLERAIPEITDLPDAQPIVVERGHIKFENVTFRYRGNAAPLYKNFSCEIQPGEKVGLVGASGAGKSTFVKLIQRMYDPESGRILIDGQDISSSTQSSLRSIIGHVPQDAILFHRSLRENIAYGRPDAAHNEIIAAAHQAHAHAFIEKLEAGYDTVVGERGLKLSGGERQRVAIARAILSQRPILILDEATSSLDSISERYIRDAIETIAKGRTTIIIAHRLSTVKSLDRILVFDRGVIVESGSHAELLQLKHGYYRQLLKNQEDSTDQRELAVQ